MLASPASPRGKRRAGNAGRNAVSIRSRLFPSSRPPVTFELPVACMAPGGAVVDWRLCVPSRRRNRRHPILFTTGRGCTAAPAVWPLRDWRRRRIGSSFTWPRTRKPRSTLCARCGSTRQNPWPALRRRLGRPERCCSRTGKPCPTTISPPIRTSSPSAWRHCTICQRPRTGCWSCAWELCCNAWRRRATFRPGRWCSPPVAPSTSPGSASASAPPATAPRTP